MARRHKTQKVVDAVGAMVEADIPVEEMRARLANDECGLGYKKTISRRTLYGYRGDYLDDKRHSAARQDSAVETVASVKQQAIDLLHRELVTLDRKAKHRGMSKDEVTIVHRIHSTLDDMERREILAMKRRTNRPKQPNQHPKAKSAEPENETAMQKAAREFSERTAQSPPITDPPQDTPKQTAVTRELDTASNNTGQEEPSESCPEEPTQDLGLPQAQEQQRSPAMQGIEPDQTIGSSSRLTSTPTSDPPASAAQARALAALDT